MPVYSTGKGRYDSLNNYNAVVKLVYGNISFILRRCRENPNRTYYPPLGDLKCQVLKVGHHGSSTSTSDPF